MNATTSMNKPDIEVYGKYYYMFKRSHGIPTKITVMEINGDIAKCVYGHLDDERITDIVNGIALCERVQCKISKIITHITENQHRIIERQEKEFEEYLNEAEKELYRFKYGEEPPWD